MNESTECFCTIETIIDVLHPITGLTACYGRTLEETRAARPEYANAERMTVEAFCERKAERQRTPIEWRETTEARFDEMLNVLPPALWLHEPEGGFLVGEPMDHDAGNGRPRFEGFRIIGGKYHKGNRPMTREEFKAECSKGAA